MVTIASDEFVELGDQAQACELTGLGSRERAEVLIEFDRQYRQAGARLCTGTAV